MLIRQAQTHSAVRSGQYISPILSLPAMGETKINKTTISFNPQDIIQHYAGFDYFQNTWNDIFVYESILWKRFNFVIEQLLKNLTPLQINEAS